ncbi:universal stress protein [Variovorax sp. J22R133]|uniref:universal stress protein n=1 Tax=Variovorax brevis TaxID=3053503 RepID=UPI002574C679|nr:universal stress protein [Variovorax sp. J22R133]MDM0110850.1 universal stress protein [Variovorax sp. J22R133]
MYKRILVPLDGSEPSSLGLDHAIGLASSVGAALRLVHFVDQFKPLPGIAGHAAYMELLTKTKDEGQQVLQQGQERAEMAGVTVETALLSSPNSKLSDVIAADARAWGADLIVIGTHGRKGIERILWGSDTVGVVRGAPVPVLIVHEPKNS